MDREQKSEGEGRKIAGRDRRVEIGEQGPRVRRSLDLFTQSSHRCLASSRHHPSSAFLLAAWLVAAEIGTGIWYRSRETNLSVPVIWTITMPLESAAVMEKPLESKAKQMLRFDEALNASWEDRGGRYWQAIFLRWKPGRVAARLAKDHTPAICLSAVGRVLLAPVQEESLPIPGLRIRALIYSATDPVRGKVRILYFLHEDDSVKDFEREPASIWKERIAPVFAGRRNRGMRSLELAVWGIEDDQEAKRVLLEQARRIIRVESSSKGGGSADVPSAS